MNNAEDRPNCPKCGSSRPNRNGKPQNIQIYRCRSCKFQWRHRAAVGKHRFSPEQIGAAISMFYTSLSFRRVAIKLKEKFNIRDTDVAPQTIRSWVRNYTCAAERLARDCKGPGGGTWWLCSQAFDDYRQMWWIVVDGATGYILGTHLASITTTHYPIR